MIIFRYIQAALKRHVKMNSFFFIIFKSSKNIYTGPYEILMPLLGPNTIYQWLFCKQAGKQDESIPLITILLQ